jgi:hypothetical protein
MAGESGRYDRVHSIVFNQGYKVTVAKLTFKRYVKGVFINRVNPVIPSKKAELLLVRFLCLNALLSYL